MPSSGEQAGAAPLAPSRQAQVCSEEPPCEPQAGASGAVPRHVPGWTWPSTDPQKNAGPPGGQLCPPR